MTNLHSPPLISTWIKKWHHPSFSPKSLLMWLVAFSPPMVWAGIIFFLSSQSSLQSIESSTLDFFFKKLAHITVYAVLFTLLHRGFRLTLTSSAKTNNPHAEWLLPLVVVFLYAVTDELHQSFVPGRYATTRDVGYDMLGVAIALLRQYRYI